MFSQVAFKIIKLPKDTGNTDIFMASNLNIWNSSDAQFKFNKDLEWNYSLINPGMFWRKKTYSQLSGQNTKSAFQKPQLISSRKIWTYLPSDYQTSQKNILRFICRTGKTFLMITPIFPPKAKWMKRWKIEDDTMLPEIEIAHYELRNNFVIPKNIIVKIEQNGKHSETFWKRELKKALMWLLR